MIVIINHILAFSLEFALLATFVIFGYQVTEHPVARWIVPVVLVILAIGLWGRYAAPSSGTRLLMPGLLIFKGVMFAAGIAALFGVGKPMWAIVFGALVVCHLALATALNQV